MLLFDKDADVDAQGGGYGNALQAASAEGHEQVVELLLDEGADELEMKVNENNVRVLESEHLETLTSTVKLVFTFTSQNGNEESVLLLDLASSLAKNPSILY